MLSATAHKRSGLHDKPPQTFYQQMPDTCCGHEVITARNGSPVLRVTTEDSRRITLHSLRNPQHEARCRCADLVIPQKSIVIIVGAGSGYHIEAILEKLNHEIVVIVEKEFAILRHLTARSCMRKQLEKNQLFFLWGDDPEKVVSHVSRIQVRFGMKRLVVLEHEPSVHAFPSYYQPLLSRLRTIAATNIVSKLRYDKFKKTSLSIIILHSRYYLVPEIIRALRSLGHHVHTTIIATGTDRTGTPEMLEGIIKNIVHYQPDFVLTVNHLGFDREGILTRFFTDIELPYASWYVDSPTFILEDFQEQRSTYLALFVWDRDYCEDLMARGFERVFFLPLATDTGIFKKNSSPQKFPGAAVGFVGNSGEESIAINMHKIGGGTLARNLVERLAGVFAASPCRSLRDISIRLEPEEQILLATKQKVIEQAVTWRASQLYRVACVRKLLKFNPIIHGDAGWTKHLHGGAQLLPELNYYDELPQFYCQCAINFNTTSLQMKNGMNQRVFDVPACGGFLLTDYRAQLEEAFQIGREVICYHHVEEIEELVGYYLKHESDRQKIARAAHERVVRDHTYAHRLNRLVTTMRQLYG